MGLDMGMDMGGMDLSKDMGIVINRDMDMDKDNRHGQTISTALPTK